MLTIPGHKGNANQITLKFYLTPVRIAPPATNVGEDGGTGRTLIHCW
jgi:hypothetical protein